MKPPTDLELSLLRHLANAGASTVREIADDFGNERGYARTTVQTLLERLRSNGHVAREKERGVYAYRSVYTPAELGRMTVSHFVDKALGGSTSPLVSYLADAAELSDQELAELKRLIDRMEAGSDG